MDDTKLLLSRLEDLVYKCSFEGIGFLGFLNERECAVAVSYLNNIGLEYSLFGGYNNANRVYVCVNTNDTTPCFPIKALKITPKSSGELSHRDYLGALMGLGIKRECIGDIVKQKDNAAVVFVREEISAYILGDLNKIGRESVSVCEFLDSTDSLVISTEEIRLIITSLRIDNFVSSCINSSRSEAVRLISSDKVFVNYQQVYKPSMTIKQGDVVSIRGYGKYKVGLTTGKTRSDRLVINVSHYI